MPTLFGSVRGDGGRHPEPLSYETRRVDTLRYECLHHRQGTVFAENSISLLATDVVGMPDYFYRYAGVVFEERYETVYLVVGLGVELERVERKENILEHQAFTSLYLGKLDS